MSAAAQARWRAAASRPSRKAQRTEGQKAAAPSLKALPMKSLANQPACSRWIFRPGVARATRSSARYIGSGWGLGMEAQAADEQHDDIIGADAERRAALFARRFVGREARGVDAERNDRQLRAWKLRGPEPCAEKLRLGFEHEVDRLLDRRRGADQRVPFLRRRKLQAGNPVHGADRSRRVRDAGDRVAALVEAPPAPGMLRDAGIRQVERAGLARRTRIRFVQPLDRARVPMDLDRSIEMLGLFAARRVAVEPVHVGVLHEAFEEAFTGRLPPHEPRPGGLETLRAIRESRRSHRLP